MATSAVHRPAVTSPNACRTTPTPLPLNSTWHPSARSPVCQINGRKGTSIPPRVANASQPTGSQDGLTAGQPSQPAEPAGQQPGFWHTLKRKLFGNQKLDRQRIAALGLAGIATYGLISNINAGIMIAVAWTTIVKTYGVTPLAAGMWPKFLVAYGGLWVGSHFLRPLRLSLAVALTPLFDSGLNNIQNRLRVPKAAAFAIMLVAVAAVSLAFSGTAVWVAGGFNTTATAATLAA